MSASKHKHNRPTIGLLTYEMKGTLATSYLDPKGMTLPTVTLAANVVFMVPLVVLFFLGQQAIMKSVVTSGLKG